MIEPFPKEAHMATTQQRSRQVELTDEQVRAAALVAQGKTASEAAEELATDASRVTAWQRSAHFVAEVNRQRHATWTAAQDRLRGLVPRALETLEEALRQGDVRAAVEVLRAVGLYGKVDAPAGQTDPELVMVEQARTWAEAEILRRVPDRMALLLSEGEQTELARRRLEELRQQLA